MQCPVCVNTRLAMTEREGIEIDYCPECRGVWLDRGELDKIIERSGEAPIQDDKNRGADSKQFKGKRKKRESLLGELLDF